ncbi:MAG TPA: DUF4145 domain-containing protein [Ktedonobacteraceae bacterium]
MKCPHCRVDFHDQPKNVLLGEDPDGGWKLIHRRCSSCDKLIFHLVNGEVKQLVPGSASPESKSREAGHIAPVAESHVYLVRPKGSSRPPCPPEVPKEIAEDYSEACLVLNDSPKASAAMSRRCLQHILIDPNAANAQQRDLADQIEYILKSQTLPIHIARVLDAVRNIGNFAAHPMKTKTTGEILPVEPGEAELNLDVIEALFDFYYVQPAIIQTR